MAYIFRRPMRSETWPKYGTRNNVIAAAVSTALSSRSRGILSVLVPYAKTKAVKM